MGEVAAFSGWDRCNCKGVKVASAGFQGSNTRREGGRNDPRGGRERGPKGRRGRNEGAGGT